MTKREHHPHIKYKWRLPEVFRHHGRPQLVSFGFQRSDEGFHADNEFMRIPSFRTGQRAYARLIHALVEQPKREK